MHRHHKPWTQAEDEELAELLGRYSMPAIARTLGRTLNAVTIRICHLGLGSPLEATGMLTIGTLAKKVGSKWQTVKKWTEQGLKCQHRILRNERRFYLIAIEDFWEWAKDNKDKIHFNKIDINSLPPEPNWVQAERLKPSTPRGGKQWTRYEEIRLTAMVQADMSWPKIADNMGRTIKAVTHRAFKLKQQGKLNGKTYVPWTNIEVDMMLQMEKQGMVDKDIAYKLGREKNHIEDKRRYMRNKGIYQGTKYQNMGK